MAQLRPVSFESGACKQVYKQVEQNGLQSVEALRDMLQLSAEEIERHLQRLEQQGYIERRGQRLGIALDLGERQRYETSDFEYTVRPAHESDIDDLVDVVEEIAENKTYAVAEELAAELRYDERIIRHNTSNSRVCFVATTADSVIGWSHLDLPLTKKLRPTARLTVGVSEDYRGYGVGKQLMNRALAWADDYDYLRVYKNLARTNVRAISFLKAHGWEQECVRQNHYRIGHKKIDQITMVYTF
jgi:GNAT superfamily N-acetyltransferase